MIHKKDGIVHKVVLNSGAWTMHPSFISRAKLWLGVGECPTLFQDFHVHLYKFIKCPLLLMLFSFRARGHAFIIISRQNYKYR